MTLSMYTVHYKRPLVTNSQTSAIHHTMLAQWICRRETTFSNWFTDLCHTTHHTMLAHHACTPYITPCLHTMLAGGPAATRRRIKARKGIRQHLLPRASQSSLPCTCCCCFFSGLSYGVLVFLKRCRTIFLEWKYALYTAVCARKHAQVEDRAPQSCILFFWSSRGKWPCVVGLIVK